MHNFKYIKQGRTASLEDLEILTSNEIFEYNLPSKRIDDGLAPAPSRKYFQVKIRKKQPNFSRQLASRTTTA